MFNDKYGLTEAVLSGRKTMTRRIEKDTCFDLCLDKEGLVIEKLWFEDDYYFNAFINNVLLASHKTRYKVGEIVAIAQDYWESLSPNDLKSNNINNESKGWRNKMFIKPNLMPHQIMI